MQTDELQTENEVQIEDHDKRTDVHVNREKNRKRNHKIYGGCGSLHTFVTFNMKKKNKWGLPMRTFTS